MGNFDTLYKGVMRFEKGYTANDQGYPAYGGINKGSHPTWPGWEDIAKKAAEGKLKQAAFFPELEPKVIAFYTDFWKPVMVDKINNLELAQLLVDMKTQHGKWARIINAAQQNKNPLDKSVSNNIGATQISWINNDTAAAYQAITAKRLYYVKNIVLKNEADRKSIIARAQSYFNKAIDFVKNNAGTTAGGSLATIALLAAAFFF